MTLIVEDGTGIANANSYNTLVELRAYATARGVTLDASDAVVEIQSTKAMDVLEGFRAEYQGAKTDATNALQWPRKDVLIDCEVIADNVIPVELKSAQAQLVMAVEAGIDLLPTVSGNEGHGLIIKEVVDVLETEYSDKGPASVRPNIEAVDVLLKPLFIACGTGAALRSLRI